MLWLIATLSFTLVSCSDDEPGGEGTTFSVSSVTESQIKATFPGLRLDSIKSSKDYDNIKITYDGDLLVSYKECYTDGKVHDGVFFTLTYSKDTVYVNNGSCKAVIGDNGLVEKLILPFGKINSYTYDEENHLIRYDVDIARSDDKQYYELTWENGNVVTFRNNYQYQLEIPDGPWHYEDFRYTYSSDENIAGLLPVNCPVGCWINDTGLSMGSDVNLVLYYAGLLGRGTKNLPMTISQKYDHEEEFREIKKFSYILNESGYVSEGTDNIFPTYPETETYFYK